MFETILSPIPGFARRLNIFSAYQIDNSWGSALTQCLIVAGDIYDQKIMAQCTYNTHLLFSAPYTYVSQRTNNPPNVYITNSVIFLLITPSCILTNIRVDGNFLRNTMGNQINYPPFLCNCKGDAPSAPSIIYYLTGDPSGHSVGKTVL